MGTHPIFESDFDCLTEWANTDFQSILVEFLIVSAPVMLKIFSRAMEKFWISPSSLNMDLLNSKINMMQKTL